MTVTRRVFLGATALLPLGCSSFRPANVLDFLPEGTLNIRDLGAKGDGITDDTEALAKAHALDRPLYYPKTKNFYRVSQAIQLTSSAISDGAEIRIAQDGTGERSIFKIIRNQTPVRISGFVLDGSYDGGTKSEFSHGVELKAARDVTIENNTVRNVYGDCVYVGSSESTQASHNIRVENNTLLNPRRCNVAVVCADRVIIARNKINKSTAYVAAIDLEPNRNGFDYVKNVIITDNTFEVAKVFVLAGVNNKVPNSGLEIERNSGRGLCFLVAHNNALITDATIGDNAFTASAPNGGMLILSGLKNTSVTGNIDATPCAGNYQSVVFDTCDLRLKNNSFCGSSSINRTG